MQGYIESVNGNANWRRRDTSPSLALLMQACYFPTSLNQALSVTMRARMHAWTLNCTLEIKPNEVQPSNYIHYINVWMQK